MPIWPKYLWQRLAFIVSLVVFLALAVLLFDRVQLAYDLARARSVRTATDAKAAATQLEALGKLYPLQPEVAYLLAIAHRRAGSTKQAEQDLKRAAELGWPRKDLLRQRHMIDFQSGKIQEAEPQLRQLLAEDAPDDMANEVYECMVMGYLSDVRLADAELCLRYWLDWQPDSVQAHVLQTDILNAAHDSRALVAECQTILKLDPANQTARLRLGFALLDHKDALGAKEHFEEYLRLYPNIGAAQVGLAACQRQLGDVVHAKTSLDQALVGDLSDAQRPFALGERGQIALAEKSYDEAKSYLEEALRLAPGDPGSHYSLALVLSRLGDNRGADEHLEISRKLADKAARLTDAIDEIMRDPSDVGLRCEAGELLLDLGNSADALPWLLSALRIERWHAPTHHALARYYNQVGNQPMAQQHLAWAAKAETASKADVSAALITP